MRPRALDLFCGAGGVSEGLRRAGFEVTGVDIRLQPRYRGGVFVQGDALTYSLEGFDLVWASPPCQAWTVLRNSRGYRSGTHPQLIEPMRRRLAGRCFIIENVPRAPLLSPVTLCGSMFGLDVRRHRIFEASLPLRVPPCNHASQAPRFRSLDRRQKSLSRVVTVHGHGNYRGEKILRQRAMGIDWMTIAELSQAIPPAYAEYLGKQVIDAL